MRSKRLFSLLLTFCMLLSMLAPAASAIETAAADFFRDGTILGDQQADADKKNDLVISGDNAIKGNTLRDDLSHVKNPYQDVSLRGGKWIATSVDGTTTVLSNAQLPEDLKKLTEAADQYTTQDMVDAFVVLEDAPSAERHSSIQDVPQKEVDYLSDRQSQLIGLIEEEVLGGESLQVISQFTI